MKYLLTLIAAIVECAAVADAVPPEEGEHSVLKAVVHVTLMMLSGKGMVWATSTIF